MRKHPKKKERQGTWWKPWTWQTVVVRPVEWQIHQEDQESLNNLLNEGGSLKR